MSKATEVELEKPSAIKIIAAIAVLILIVFLGRAALAYYGNTSICFKPLRMVSDQDHINAAVSYLKRPYIYAWEMRYGGGKANVAYLRGLDPNTCCKVLRRGRWKSESFNKVTYYTTFTGSYSRIVDLGPMPVYHPNTSGYQIRFRVPTTVCGTLPHEYTNAGGR